MGKDKKDFAQIYLQKLIPILSGEQVKKLEILYLRYPSQVQLIKDSEEGIFHSGTIISEQPQQPEGWRQISLDFKSIMKASQIISGEIILEKLISSLMKILVETAGAEKGVLLLEENGEFTVVAKWN